MIRTASKAFATGVGADEKSGCQGPFREYVKDILSDNNLHSIPLKPYRGSRFNVLFENASTVFFMNDKITEFFESYNF